MFKSIDDTNEKLEGFKYANKHHEEEFVVMEHDDGIVTIQMSGDSAAIFVEDIPKLVKALLAAEDYMRHNGGS